jgi:hypothetical protein
MSLVNTQAHRAARNAASIALADAGPGNSSIKLYTAQGGTLLGTRMLAMPCGTVRPSDGRIVLATGDSPDVVMATGAATWAEWHSGAGVAISAGRVTDTLGNITDGTGAVVPHPDGVGTFVLGGTTGTSLYIGGLVLLYTGLIG